LAYYLLHRNRSQSHEEEFDRSFGLNRDFFDPGLLDRSITPMIDVQEKPDEFVVSADPCRWQ